MHLTDMQKNKVDRKLPQTLKKLLRIVRRSVLAQCLLLFSLVLLAHSWYGLTHINFSQDQARDSFIVAENVKRGEYVVGYGPKTSVGNFTVFPFYYQLFSLVQLISDHPLNMHVVVIILESLTPVFLYLLLIQYVKKKIAFFAAIFYAFSFLTLQYSTSAWSPNLLPLLSTISLWGWFRFLNHRSYKHLFFGVFFLALSLHLHFQSLILLPFAGLVFVYAARQSRKSWKYLLIGTLFGLITYLPYVTAEIRNDWQNTRAIYSFYTQDHAGYFDRVSKIEYVTSFYPAVFERSIMGKNTYLLFFGRLLFFSGMVLILVKSWRSTRFRWLFAYLILAIVMVRMFKGDKHDYYLLPFMIFPSLFLALLLNQLQRWLVVTLVVLALSGIVLTNFTQPRNNQYEYVKNNAAGLAAELGAHDSVHLIFHDLDAANSMLYFLLRDESITFDKQSNVLVDVCLDRSSCIYDGLYENYTSQVASYSAKLKQDNQYFVCRIPKPIGAFWTTAVQLDVTEGKLFPELPPSLSSRKDFLTSEIN